MMTQKISTYETINVFIYSVVKKCINMCIRGNYLILIAMVFVEIKVEVYYCLKCENWDLLNLDFKI